MPTMARKVRCLLRTPCLVFLAGEMAAGKTTLLQALFPSLPVSSPSYPLMHAMGEVVHGDFYRLADGEGLECLELPLYLAGRDYFFVEWGEGFAFQLRRLVDESWAIYRLGVELDQGAGPDVRNYILCQEGAKSEGN